MDVDHPLILVVVIRSTEARMSLIALDGGEVDRLRVTYTPQTRDRVLDKTVAGVAAEYGGCLLIA